MLNVSLPTHQELPPHSFVLGNEKVASDVATRTGGVIQLVSRRVLLHCTRLNPIHDGLRHIINASL